MLDHEPGELAEDLVVAPGREIGVDRALDRPEPQLVQPPDLRRRERLVGDVDERGPAPESEHVPRLAGGQPPVGLQRQIQPRDVHIGGPASQVVPSAVGDDLDVAVAQRLAEPGDVLLHELGRARRRLALPQALDDPIRRHRPVASSASIANTARCFFAPSSSGRPSRRTSTGPNRRMSKGST
jgi:hypothetical protein